MERLRYPVAALAFAGLLMSLWVHVSAVLGIDLMQAWPQLWGLHVGVFVVFLPFVLVCRRLFGRKPSLQVLRATWPTWLIVPGAVLLVYVAFNFALTMHTLVDGSAAVRDGQYVLQIHGHVVRAITASQYQAGKASEARLFSGHWLFFYFLPFAFFAFARLPQRGGSAPGSSRP